MVHASRQKHPLNTQYVTTHIRVTFLICQFSATPKYCTIYIYLYMYPQKQWLDLYRWFETDSTGNPQPGWLANIN